MTRLLLQRADEVAPGVPRAETSLIIVGHGTNLNENSTKAIQDQVRLIREGGHGFAEVMDAYMEEAPFVADWAKMTRAPNVVVVPFFIADGLHSYQDIPVLLGMESEPGAAASEREVFRHNPHHLQGKCLHYSSAIGTEPHMADVILDQVEAFDRKHVPQKHVGAVSDITAALSRWLDAGKNHLGQVSVMREGQGKFFLTHVDDVGRRETLKRGTSPLEACEIAKYDDAGAFRPLKTAPTLRHGWLLELTMPEEVVLALDFLYPAALGLALEEEKRSLQPVPLRDLLGRQTGMYRFANHITDDQAMDMTACHCDTRTKCLRRITWGLTARQPLSGAATEKAAALEAATAIPLLCMEACNHIVSAARKIARENHDAKAALENSAEQAGKPASH
jgi:sirohydrochlorin cobaltochelatase